MTSFELYEEIKLRAGWTGGTPEWQRASAIAYQALAQEFGDKSESLKRRGLLP